mmetsp:Transcript_21347/g.21475  ORF Transcript_21347/g.21475 Transcript_21347/m.21475 type:complete len:473 (+) Transcript_21347:90-1508(+)
MSSSEIMAMLEMIAGRLSVIEGSLGIQSSSVGTSGKSGAVLPRFIVAFDNYCQSFVTPFVDACSKLGGDALTLGKLTKEAFDELRSFLLMASACKEPPQAGLVPLMAGLSGKMKAIGQVVQRNEWEKHSKTVNEGLGCLNWVCVKPAPMDFIETYIGGSDYWANGIRKEYRTTNPDHILFCDTFKTLIKELIQYVKEHHTTGVTWNPRGGDVTDYTPGERERERQTEKGVSSTGGKPSPVVPGSGSGSTLPAPPNVNLFAALNKGGEITSGLKTVTRDQQTWRAEYKGGEGPTPAVSKAVPSKRAVEVPKGPAKLEFQEGPHKWIVEYQGAESGLVTVNITDKKQTVYIFGCIDASVSIVGKCKSVVVDSCKKTKVYYDTLMASCEVVNCQRMHVECREKVASVAIDKTDGIIVQLPASSLDTTVVASKSSEMNITFPDENGEMIEKPIPEQYIHRISGTSITADVSDLYTH